MDSAECAENSRISLYIADRRGNRMLQVRRLVVAPWLGGGGTMVALMV